MCPAGCGCLFLTVGSLYFLAETAAITLPDERWLWAA